MANSNRTLNSATTVDCDAEAFGDYIEEQRRLLAQAMSILECALAANVQRVDESQLIEPVIERDLVSNVYRALDSVEIRRAIESEAVQEIVQQAA